MYVAIINQPGYLPETEPAEFDSISEAWAYLADELENDWPNYDATFDSFIEHHRKMQQWGEAYNAALAADTVGYIEAPNGLFYSVEIAE